MIVVPVEQRIDWKRPPLVLIALVLVNFLVFVFYQSSDAEIQEDAVDLYRYNQLLEVELPAYKAYLRKVDRKANFDPKDPYLMWYIVNDPNFSKFVKDHKRRYIPANKRGKWSRARAEVENVSAKTSINSFGLNPYEIEIITLLSHQFLHGDIFHLLGNMVFLVLTGFAVEAALGSRKFITFYLLSGIGGGLLFSFFQAGSGIQSGNLVGASGSISGVMAMYVVLYGLRKIEFFYWLFIFTGYFRAVAIVMLPAYILKELYFLVFTDGSNVAYTAHIGGFVIGAILVYLTQSLMGKSIDTDYLDGPAATRDPYFKELQTLYTHIERCDFKPAYERLQNLCKQRPNDSELADIEFNLLRALRPAKIDQYLTGRLGKAGNSRLILEAQAKMWKSADQAQRAALTGRDKSALIEALIDIQYFDVCEDVFRSMEAAEGEDRTELATSARIISNAYRVHGNRAKAKSYDQRARELMESKAAPLVNRGDFDVL